MILSQIAVVAVLIVIAGLTVSAVAKIIIVRKQQRDGEAERLAKFCRENGIVNK
jgi:hypothetical protein